MCAREFDAMWSRGSKFPDRPSPIEHRGQMVERYELLDRREQLLPCSQLFGASRE